MIVVVLLACVSSAIVLFQSWRIAVLYDLSYIIEHAYRISWGDIPYKDFGIPHPPGTFLIQAFIIKIFGVSLFNHIVYSAIVSALTVLLTHIIILKLSRDKGLSVALTLPIAITGGYGIYSYPFYDPDSMFWVLVAILFIIHMRERVYPTLETFLVGMAVCIPPLFKQNTGLMFLVLSHAALIAIGFNRREPKKYLVFLAGTIAASGAILWICYATAGLLNVFHWTFEVASMARPLSLDRIISDFLNKVVFVGLLLWIIAWVVLLNSTGIVSRARRAAAAGLFIAPTVVIPTAGSIFLGKDFFSYALNVWPITLVALLALCVGNLWREKTKICFHFLLALIVFGVTIASFLSQGVWGSTYGIMPLLVIMFCLIVVLAPRVTPSVDVSALRVAVLLQGLILAFVMTGYVWKNQRMVYVHLEGEPHNVRQSTLRGLNTPGPWLPEMEAFLEFAKREFSSNEGVMLVPGEDPFHFALQRRPAFPVLTFDQTVCPYTDEQLYQMAREKQIRWLVVKRNLQAKGTWDFSHLVQTFQRGFMLYKQFPGYDVYRSLNAF